MKKHFTVLILILIISLGLFLRLNGIKWGLPEYKNQKFSFHADEPAVLDSVMEICQRGLSGFNPMAIFHGTMQYHILSKIFAIAGVMGFAKPEPSLLGVVAEGDRKAEINKLYLIGRLTTVFFSLATILLIFFLGKSLYNETVGLLGAFFLAVLPMDVVNAHYLKMDIAVTLWIVVVCLFALEIMKSGRLIWYILAGTAAGFAAATKYNGVISLIFILVATGLNIYRKNGKRQISSLLLAFVFFFIGFFIGEPESVFSFKSFLRVVAIYKAATLKGHLDALNRGPLLFYYIKLLYYGMGFPILLFSIGGILYAIYSHLDLDIFLLCWVILYYIIVSFYPWPMVHYYVLITPFLMIIAARFLLEWAKKGSVYKWIIVPLSLLVAFYTFSYSLAYTNMMARKDNRIKAGEWIESNIPQNSEIGFCRYWFYSPPINTEDYWVRNIGYNSEILDSRRFDYIVISEYEYRQYLRLKDLFPEQYSFLKELFYGKKYKLSREFKDFPYLWRIRFPNRFPPHDWVYPYPTLRIYQKR